MKILIRLSKKQIVIIIMTGAVIVEQDHGASRSSAGMDSIQLHSAGLRNREIEREREGERETGGRREEREHSTMMGLLAFYTIVILTGLMILLIGLN